MDREEFTAEEIGLETIQVKPEQQEFTAEELGLTPEQTTPVQQEFTAEEIGLEPEEPKRGTFIGGIKSAGSDFLDMTDIGFSTVVPGGKDANQAAKDRMKEQESAPQEGRFSYAAIEDAFKRGGLEGLKELVLQLPGGAGEALGMLGPSVAAGITGGALGGPVGALLAIAASSFLPNLGGNVMEQAAEDLAQGRPVDIETAKAIVTAIGQAGIDVIPFKFAEPLKRLIGIDKKSGGELRKKIAEQGVTAAIGKDALAIIGTELPAEITQEILQKIQAGVDPFSPEAIAEYKEVAALVTLTGGVGVYTGLANRSNARKEIAEEESIEEDKKLQEEADETDSRQQAINATIKEEENAIKAEEEVKAAERVKKNKITVIDEQFLKDLGINPKTRVAQQILGMDLSDPANLEMIDNILAEENLQVKNNKEAVKNFRKKVKRDRKKLLKSQEETQLEEQPATKRKRTRASNKIPNDRTPIVTQGTGASDTTTVDANRTSTGRPIATTGASNNPLITKVEKKNPLVKGKAGSKARVGRINNGAVQVIEGVLEDSANGLQLVTMQGRTKITIPLNEQQILNPTKKDLAKLEAKAEETKPAPVSEVKDKPKTKPSSPERKLLGDTLNEATEEELNAEGYESFIELDEKGNERKRFRNIKTKKPLFAKATTETERQLAEVRKQKQLAIERAENQRNQDGRISPAYRKPIMQLQQMEDKLLKQDIQEKKQSTPEQQELFAKDETIPDTGETKQSVMSSFISEFGKNVNLGVKRGLLNIVDTVADLPNSIPNVDILPNNVKAIYFDGKAYFIADRITKEDAPRMLLHEIGAHYGLVGMLGKANYDRVVKSLRDKKTSDAEIEAAFKYVRDSYPELTESSDDFIQEVIANIAEDAPNNTVYRRIVGYIKNFLSKLGMGWNVDNITAAQIQDMVQHSVRVSLAQPDINPTTQSALASRVVSEVGQLFYSPLEKAIASQKIESMSPQEWMDYLNKRARKQGFSNQLDSTGIMDWMKMLQRYYNDDIPTNDMDGFELDARGRLSKEDILAWLGQYDIVVESITPEGPMSESEIENIREEETARIREEIENNGTYDDILMEVDEEAGYVDDQIEGVFRIFGSEHRGKDQDFKEEPYAVFIVEDLLETEPVRKYYELAQDKGFDVRIVPTEKTGFGEHTAADSARDYLYETHNPEIEETNRIVDERMSEIVDNRVQDIIDDVTQERDSRYGEMQRTRDDKGGVPEEYFEIILALDNRGGNMGNIYESPHWESVQNPVLHIRADIRYDQSGNKVLFVEEVQSDWAEARRKKPVDYRKDRDKAFVEDTQLWTRLAVKRIVRLAAENDVDKVAFLNPAQAVNVHYRTDKAAEVYYGEILPSVVRKTINSLENTNRRANEEIKFKPIYKVDDKTLDLLREVYVEGKNIMQGSRGYSDFDREDSTPTDKARFKRINDLVSRLNTMSDSNESFRDIYEFANRIVKITQSYMDNTDLLRPETRKEVLEGLTKSFRKFQEQMANLERIDNLRKEIQRRLAADRKANPDVPMGMNETQKELIRRDRDLQEERVGAPRPDIRQYNFLNLLIGKGVLTMPEINNRQVGFTMTPKLRQVAKEAMPMFAKQNSKSRSQLIKETEEGKSAREKINDKRRKKNRNKVPDKYEDDEFFKKNTTLGERTRGFQNAVFGYDIGLYNKIKDQIAKVAKAKNVQDARKYIEDTLAKISTAQAVHAQTLAGAFKELGNIVYKPAIEKFEAFKDDNSMHNISTKVHKFARKYFKKGALLTKEDIIAAEQFISQAIVALQFKRIKENNVKLQAAAKLLVRQGKKQAAKTLLQQKYVQVEMDDATIDKHIARLEEFPEIKDIQETWIGVKNNALQFLLDSEVIDQEQFDAYTLEGGVIEGDVFVPLYRQGQQDVPRSVVKGTNSGRGIFVRRKGTAEPVANVFVNMDTFVQSAITQGIANKTALNKIRASEEVQEEGDLIVRQVPEATEGFESHAVRVSEIGPDGKQSIRTYEYANEMYAKATNGASQAMSSGSNFMSVFMANTSTLLRDSIVLNPVFGVAQTFVQDMYSAMYTSGLRYGWFMIPMRVLYQFPATILNLSGTHKELSRYGAVGGYAFKQNDNTIDADINAPGFYNRLIRAISRVPGTNIPTGLTQEGAIQVGDTRLSLGGLLNRIAMASDNSVRQAVYNQALLENKSQRRALEMAFEIINFRKMGDNDYITMGRQYIPFFGAALQALSVQGKVIQGLVKPQSGVTPTSLREARINFLITWAGTAGMTLIYSILMDDDEDEIMEQFGDMPLSEEIKTHLKEVRRNFGQLDNKIRDRRFIIGDDGFHLTLRPDIFTFISKIIPEQVYNTIVAQDQDAAKFWLSIKRNLKEIVTLNLIPQVIRPMIDVRYNEDNRTGRPIVPQRMENLRNDQQYTPRTSEAAKKIAGIIGASPIVVDYYFRQYTGYTGALVSLLTDAYFLEADTNPNRKNKPAVSTRDQIASFPGMTNFYSRDKDNRFMSDYYELKNKTSQVAAIFRKLDSSPNPEDQMKAQQYLNEGNNRLIYNTNVEINQIQETLTMIRQERQRIYEYPASATLNGKPMTDERKRELMLRLDAQEIQALQTVHDLRLKIYGINPFYNAEKNEYMPGFDSSSFFEKNN